MEYVIVYLGTHEASISLSSWYLFLQDFDILYILWYGGRCGAQD
jgi:hypothetical protein